MKKHKAFRPRISDTNYVNLKTIDDDYNGKTPFPTEQCEKCAFWMRITYLTRACHYTVYTGKIRENNPPTCSCFADKDTTDIEKYLKAVRGVYDIMYEDFTDDGIAEIRKEVGACEESEE